MTNNDKEQLERVAGAIALAAVGEKSIRKVRLKEVEAGLWDREAQAAIDAMRPEWLPIENVPTGVDVWVCDENNVSVMRFSKIEIHEWRQVDDETKKLITYEGAGNFCHQEPACNYGDFWMPFIIPTPPKE